MFNSSHRESGFQRLVPKTDHPSPERLPPCPMAFPHSPYPPPAVLSMFSRVHVCARTQALPKCVQSVSRLPLPVQGQAASSLRLSREASRALAVLRGCSDTPVMATEPFGPSRCSLPGAFPGICFQRRAGSQQSIPVWLPGSLGGSQRACAPVGEIREE